MSRELFARTWRAQRLKLLAVAAALAVWGFLMPIVYQAFRAAVQVLPRLRPDPEGPHLVRRRRHLQPGRRRWPSASSTRSRWPRSSSSPWGSRSTAIAGERQRGTLEVLLARPLSRRRLYLTLLGATILFVGAAVAAEVAGTVVGTVLGGAPGDLRPDRLVLIWLNGWLVFIAIGAVTLAGVRLVRPALAGAGGQPGLRARVVLPRDPGQALARRPRPPAVVPLPLPRSTRSPGRIDARCRLDRAGRRAGRLRGRGAGDLPAARPGRAELKPAQRTSMIR